MSPEEAEKEVQRLSELTQEDLRKTIETSLREVHQASNRATGDLGLARTIARFASFLGVLSVQSDKQTRRIIKLTWAIVVLTVALLLFTAYLTYDAYLKSQRDQEHHVDSGKK